jgi:hypothetical protein
MVEKRLKEAFAAFMTRANRFIWQPRDIEHH